MVQLQSSWWWLLGWEQGRDVYSVVTLLELAGHVESSFIWHCGTAQAPACSCHLLPPFSTSMLIVFGLQDVLSSFGFDFVMCFTHLKMNIISCGGWAVTRCTLLITLCPPVFPVLGAVSLGLWLFHSFLFFPSLFKWKEEYFCLSFMNKYIHYTRSSFVWLHSLSYSDL